MTPSALLLAFDYVDPVSFVLDRALRKLLPPERTLVRLPVELPHRPASDPAGAEAWADSWAGRLRTAQAAAAEWGLTLQPPSPLPRSRKAHELGFLAREKGCFDSVHHAVFDACFLQGRDIGRVDVLARIAEEAGLDPTEARVTLDVDRLASVVDEARERASHLEIAVIPTLLWDGGGLEGYLPPDRLRSVLSEVP